MALITNLATSGHPCIWVISSKSSWSAQKLRANHSCTHAWCLSNLKSQIVRFHCCTATFDIVLCLHILLADSQLLLVHHSDWNLIRHTFHYLRVWRGQKHVKIVWSASLPTHQVTCEVSDDPMQFKEKHPTYKLILSNKYHLSYLSYIYISHYLTFSLYLIISSLQITTNTRRSWEQSTAKQIGPERLNVAAARWWSHCLAQRMRTVLRSCGPAQPIRSAALGVSCRSESIWKLIFRFEPMPWATNDIQVRLIITTCDIIPSKLSQQQWKTSSLAHIIEASLSI